MVYKVLSLLLDIWLPNIEISSDSSSCLVTFSELTTVLDLKHHILRVSKIITACAIIWLTQSKQFMYVRLDVQLVILKG